MMRRVRRCRDGLWYIQEKRAPGLAGGIWRRVGAGSAEKIWLVHV